MPHRIYISSNDDVETIRETLAWAEGLDPEEIAEAIHCLDRINIHLIRARALLDEAYKWLGAPARYPIDEYGDFLERYKSFKAEEKQVEK